MTCSSSVARWKKDKKNTSRIFPFDVLVLGKYFAQSTNQLISSTTHGDLFATI
jgi:hypothetical protein